MNADRTKAKSFWETKHLSEMTKDEWESLCDGCAQCCRLKFKTRNAQQFVITPIVCKLLDLHTCQCQSYKDRHELVPDCVEISPNNINLLYWLPDTCAYRLIAEGKPLYDWHPLISGGTQEMRRLGISVADQVLSENDVHPDDLAVQSVKWVDDHKR